MRNTLLKKQLPMAKGFTLVELLVVMSILVILGGLGVVGYTQVRDRSNNSQAETQIKMLESSLNSYELDNGYFPLAGDKLISSTNILFRELGGYDEKGKYDPDRKSYADFLDPASSGRKIVESNTGRATPQWSLKDPWGNPYRYQDAESSGSKKSDNEYTTYNPTYDLWSTGKDGVDSSGDPKLKQQQGLDDIRNW